MRMAEGVGTATEGSGIPPPEKQNSYLIAEGVGTASGASSIPPLEEVMDFLVGAWGGNCLFSTIVLALSSPSIQCLLTSNVEPYSILKESFLKFLRM